MSPLLIVALAVLGHLQLSQASDPPLACEAGWDIYNEDCYKLFTDRRTFDSAGDTCTTVHNALLTSILDAEEMAFAQELITNVGNDKRTWLGLRVFDLGVDEAWVDVRTGAYRDWADGIAQEGCSLVKKGEWIVEDCDNKAQYICRKPALCPDGSKPVCGECPPTPDCPAGWDFYGDSCYKLFKDKRTFDDAGATCTTVHNALLTSILDAEEMAFAEELIFRDGEGRRTWIGLRVHNLGVWEDLVDVRDDAGYRPWGAIELQNGCTIVKKDYWVVEDCDNKAYYLCRMLYED